MQSKQDCAIANPHAFEDWLLNMGYDLVLAPFDLQFEGRLNILHISCSTHHPLQFDMPLYGIIKFLTPGSRSPTLGQDFGDGVKLPLDRF